MRPANLLTKEQVEEFYVHGQMTTAETAAALGVSEPTLLRYMRKFGIEGRRRGIGPQAEEAFGERDALIKKHRDAGWSLGRIADKFQISKQRVSIILKKGK